MAVTSLHQTLNTTTPPTEGAPRYRGNRRVTPLLSCLADIHAREGLAGLWKGSVPSIVKAAPAAAITFAAYEALLGLMMAHTGGGGAGSGTPAMARQEASAAGGKQQQQRRKAAAAKGE